MKHLTLKRVFSVLLALIMVISLVVPTLGTSAYAANGNYKIQIGETVAMPKAEGNATWSTSNSSVASVSNDGIVTGVGEGTATITVTIKEAAPGASYGWFGFWFHWFFSWTKTTQHSYTVTVVKPVQPEEPGTSFELKVGETLALPKTANGAQWSSSDNQIATVSNDGVVTGVKAGTVTITETVKGSASSGSWWGFFWFFPWWNNTTTTTNEYTITVVNADEPQPPEETPVPETPEPTATPEPTPTPSEEPTVFSVSFNTLGGSSIGSQNVEAGGFVTVPSVPYRGGYTFAGWYTDEAATEPYDFSSAVVSNMTLYAGWEKADDYESSISTQVTDDDKYVLSVNEKEVPLGENSEVVVFVDTTLTLKDGFMLYCDNVYTGTTLYDDGDYENHRDDIPNDGCYSGVYHVTQDVESDITLVAKAQVGDSAIETNEVSVFVYGELTDEQLDLMDEIETHAAELVVSTTAEYSDQDTDILIASLKEVVENYLQQYVNSGVITDLTYDPEGYCFSWIYTDSGIDASLFLYNALGDAGLESTHAEQTLNSPKLSSAKPMSIIDVPGITYSKGNVIILNYYDENDSWSITYDQFGQSLEDAGFRVSYVYSMECADFRNLQEYNSLIMVDSHGNTINGKKTGKPMICTGELQTKTKNKETYYTDIKKGRIKKVTLSTGEKVYWIAPEFFEFYYKEHPLNSPIVYLGCCRDYPNPENNIKMVKAFKDAGACVACGYNASVSVGYDADMAETFVNELLKGETAEAAILTAKEEHGTEDWDIDAEWNRHAALNFYGSGGSTLYHILQNGYFDNPFGLVITDHIICWESYGDARGIYKLSGITPKSNPKMAIISSGFGSQNSETTSCLYQTFLVPNGSSKLEISYDVVSEEPMEYVGTKYDDIFQIDLLSTDGTLLQTIATESVNSSQWYAIDGINFPGGDNTTYHTRWKDVVSDCIGNYQNQLVILRFVIQDAGDAVFDTAALIDSVKIS